MPKNAELTRKQETFLLAHLSLPTLSAACRVAGISDDTARNWLKLPHVKAAYEQLRAEYVKQSLHGLVQMTEQAIAALKRNLSEEAPPALQIRAAQIVLEHVRSLHQSDELADLRNRLATVESLPVVAPMPGDQQS